MTAPKIGDRVKVIDPQGAFHAEFGTVEETRAGLLPWGVRLDAPDGGIGSLVWFEATELEVQS